MTLTCMSDKNSFNLAHDQIMSQLESYADTLAQLGTSNKYLAAVSTPFLLNDRHAFITLENGRLVKRFMSGLHAHDLGVLYAYNSELILHCDYVPCERERQASWGTFVVYRIGDVNPVPRVSGRVVRTNVEKGFVEIDY